MFSIKSFSLRNFRSFANTGDIAIHPLTILVGKNSAGKSSILRLFPLLRQSIETRTASPILWFGPYVDFGSLLNVVKHGEKSASIEFSLEWSETFRRKLLPINDQFSVKVELTLASNKEIDHVKKCTIKLANSIVELRISPKGNITQIQVDRHIYGQEATFGPSPSSFLPTFFELHGKSARGNVTRVYQPYSYSTPSDFQRQFAMYSLHYLRDKKLLKNVLENARKLSGHRMATNRLIGIISRLPIAAADTFSQQAMKASTAKIWQRRVADSAYRKDLEELRRSLLALYTAHILAYADDAICDYISSSHYIGPFRAVAERYYRRQQLAVDEIDHQGGNFAALLDSLPESEIGALAAFCAKNLNFEVRTVSTPGHMSVQIKESDQDWINLADSGFGYSQILPLLAQIWRVSSPNHPQSLLVAEQPELHLHPSHQYKIGRVLGHLAGQASSGTGRRRRGRPRRSMATSVVVETHSESIINAIGECIRDGLLRASDVQLLLVESTPSKGSVLRRAGYDDDGFLQNWPYGFLAPSAETN